MRRSHWATAGLVALTLVIVAAFLAPSASLIASPAATNTPAVGLADRMGRLEAMVNAAAVTGLAPTASSGGINNVQVFDNPQPQNEIAVAANPEDDRNLLIGSNDYRLRAEGFSVWAGMYTSFDGGKSWTAQLVPGYPGGPRGTLSTFNFGGDPIVAFDAHGHAYAGGIFFRGTRTGADIKDVTIALSRSDDGGKTWGDAVIAAPGKSESVFNDHPQMAVDSTGGAHDGNVYISWSKFTGANAEIWVTTSRDFGETWASVKVSVPTPPGDSNAGYQDSMVAIGPNGEVYVVWDETFKLNGAVPHVHEWMAVSMDGGATFSVPWVVEGDVVPIRLPGATYRYDTYPVAAVDPSGSHAGRLYLTWADNRLGNADIFLKYSDDGGKTWSAPTRVNDDAGTAGQFMQWISVAPGGRVDIAFYDRRNDPNDLLLDEYYVRSTDGGTTFTNVRVTTVSSNPAVWPSFIGDYNQIASTSRAAHPAWTDMRNGDPVTHDLNEDAYTATIS